MNSVEIQRISESDDQPEDGKLQQWVDATLEGFYENAEVVIRIVDELESAELNSRYRHRNSATNILSFPWVAPDLPDLVFSEMALLGDLVVCAPVLAREAQQQNKILEDHWAHIIVHGLLHLLGYDHLTEDEALLMEKQEISILQKLNISDPYWIP